MSELEFVGYGKVNYCTRTVKEFEFETSSGVEFVIIYTIETEKFSVETEDEVIVDNILEAVEYIKEHGLI